jgi:hypothetical protein
MGKGDRLFTSMLKGVMSMAKDPFQQLGVLRKAFQKGKPITDCYRLMYKKELWVRAHEQLFPLKTPNPLQLTEINDTITSLKKGIFRFQKQRKHTQNSNLYKEFMILEVINLILTSIARDTLYGSKQFNQSLKEVKRNWDDQNWWIFGEINLNESSSALTAFLKVVENKINDRRFLLLIQNALSSSAINKDMSNKRDSLLSVLYSIFFQELNLYLGEKMNERKNANTSWGKLVYFEWVNQYVLGFNGSIEEAHTFLKEVDLFFSSKFFCSKRDHTLHLSDLKKPVFLLGYHIRRCKHTNTLLFEIPNHTLKKLSKKYGDIERFVSIPRPNLLNLSERTIMVLYHGELRKIVSEYRGATNWHDLGKLFSLAKGSFIKTVAMKRKCSVKKMRLKMKSYKQGELCIRVKEKGSDERLNTFVKLKQFSFLRY